MAARERGARGLLVVTGPRSANAGELVPLTLDTAAAGSGIAAASVSGEVANALFDGSGQSLADAQKALDSGNPHVTGFDLRTLQASLTTRVVRQTQTTHNIVGYVPATEDAKSKPWVILGAHYDHLGHGGQGTSLAHADEQQAVHPGADDNASGVAAVLVAGRQLAAVRSRARHVVLAFWSGEEIGLIGSGAFVAQPPFPLDQVSAAINFDMVGRLRNNTVTVQAVGFERGVAGAVGSRDGRRCSGGRTGPHPDETAGSQPADRLLELQPGRRPDAQLLHRQPRGLSPADRRRRAHRL